jgi:micrococcal nuclease
MTAVTEFVIPLCQSRGMRTGTVACLLAIAGTACAGAPLDLTVQAPATWQREPGGHEVARVGRIIDGDTIEVEIRSRVPGPGAGSASIGGTYTVRLIGIDTPESVKPGTPVECFAKEASRAAKALLEGRSVRLVVDVEETDRYDRLLRYVYIGDEMANARLVVNGFAHAYTYPPSVRHAEFFVQMERNARENNRGLWARSACGGDP